MVLCTLYVVVVIVIVTIVFIVVIVVNINIMLEWRPLQNVMMMNPNRFRNVRLIFPKSNKRSIPSYTFYCLDTIIVHPYYINYINYINWRSVLSKSPYHLILHFLIPLFSTSSTSSTSIPILQSLQCLLPTPAANPPLRSVNLVPSCRIPPALARPTSANIQHLSSRNIRQSSSGTMFWRATPNTR